MDDAKNNSKTLDNNTDCPRVSAMEIAQRYNVTPQHIRKLAMAGKIPSMRVGQSYRFDKAAVIAAIEGRREGEQ